MVEEIKSIIEIGELPLKAFLLIVIFFLWKKLNEVEKAKDKLNQGLFDAYKENTKAMSEWVLLEKARKKND